MESITLSAIAHMQNW